MLHRIYSCLISVQIFCFEKCFRARLRWASEHFVGVKYPVHDTDCPVRKRHDSSTRLQHTFHLHDIDVHYSLCRPSDANVIFYKCCWTVCQRPRCNADTTATHTKVYRRPRRYCCLCLNLN